MGTLKASSRCFIACIPLLGLSVIAPANGTPTTMPEDIFTKTLAAMLRGSTAYEAQPRLTDGRLSYQTLSGSQIKRLLSGNTAISAGGVTGIYHDPNGSTIGWMYETSVAPFDNCISKGNGYYLDGGECRQKNRLMRSAEKWLTKGDKLCYPYTYQGKAFEECYNVAIVLDRLVYTIATGEQEGSSGYRFFKGRIDESSSAVADGSRQ